ncbi:Hypothetical protein LDBND_1083 [Lactobacillus delbrueckii subsp. bulgaricus ND02]|nr:Hypothetical protein LDBND_1083 [Lactobacillus delbrueckii subsp. bulgaricus ND02]
MHNLFGIFANKGWGDYFVQKPLAKKVWGIIITRYLPFSKKKPILKNERQKDDQKRSKSQLII